LTVTGILTTLVLMLSLVGAAGCDPDNCADLPPSFHLDVEFEVGEDTRLVQSLRVDVQTPDQQFRRIFDVADTLGDNKTSVGVVLDPAPTDDIELTVVVAVYSGTSTIGMSLAEATDTFKMDPNGCNRYRIELDLQ
jgi:hypothetical protein